MASQDMSNVLNRSHKKNSQNDKNKEHAPESSATAGDKSNKPIPQSDYLTDFSAKQTESLSKFINDAIQTAMRSLQSRLKHTLMIALNSSSRKPAQITDVNPLNSNSFDLSQKSNLNDILL